MKVLLIIIVVLIIGVIWIYNSIINLRKNIDRSKSGIDVYLQQRFDLIPNLIEVTKSYAKYENKVLEKIANLRKKYKETFNFEIGNELNYEFNNIMAVIENYPELKASEQFLNLQKALIKIESQLQAARRIYNNDVTKYNTKITIFPSNIIASIFNFKEMELFVLEGEDTVRVEM